MDINVNSICENYEEDLTELIENVKMKIAEKIIVILLILVYM